MPRYATSVPHRIRITPRDSGSRYPVHGAITGYEVAAHLGPSQHVVADRSHFLSLDTSPSEKGSLAGLAGWRGTRRHKHGKRKGKGRNQDRPTLPNGYSPLPSRSLLPLEVSCTHRGFLDPSRFPSPLEALLPTAAFFLPFKTWASVDCLQKVDVWFWTLHFLIESLYAFVSSSKFWRWLAGWLAGWLWDIMDRILE